MNTAEHAAWVERLEADWNAERTARQQLERQMAAVVDELTDAQQENARLAALIVEAYDQRDAAQAALQQADERQRQAERAAVVKALSEAADDSLTAADWLRGRARAIKDGAPL